MLDFSLTMNPTEAIYRSPLATAGGLAVIGSGRQHVTHAVKCRKLPSYAVVLVERGRVLSRPTPAAGGASQAQPFSGCFQTVSTHMARMPPVGASGGRFSKALSRAISCGYGFLASEIRSWCFGTWTGCSACSAIFTPTF